VNDRQVLGQNMWQNCLKSMPARISKVIFDRGGSKNDCFRTSTTISAVAWLFR